MCRLVREPADVAPFIPLLLPALDKLIDEVVDEEVCSVAKAARNVLLKAFGEANAAGISREASMATLADSVVSGASSTIVEKPISSIVNPLNLDVHQVRARLLAILLSSLPGGSPLKTAVSDVSLDGLNLDDPAMDTPPPAPTSVADEVISIISDVPTHNTSSHNTPSHNILSNTHSNIFAYIPFDNPTHSPCTILPGNQPIHPHCVLIRSPNGSSFGSL